MRSLHKCRLTNVRLVAGATAELKVQGKNRHGLPGTRIAGILAMNFAIGLLVLACGSLAAIAYQLRHAPEAFEDETGFHFSSSTGNRLPPDQSGLSLGAGADVRAGPYSNPPRSKPHRPSRIAATT